MKSLALLLAAGIFSISILISGCEKKLDVKQDSNRSLSEVHASASTMKKKEIFRTAQSYAKEIAVMKEKMADLQEQLKQLIPEDLTGPNAETIKSEFAAATLTLSNLTKRYEVYARQYIQLGGRLEDLSVNEA